MNSKPKPQILAKAWRLGVGLERERKGENKINPDFQGHRKHAGYTVGGEFPQAIVHWCIVELEFRRFGNSLGFDW